MLATLTDAPFHDAGWVFEDKYDGFRMVAKIEDGKVTLYSRNGKIISHSYIEVAKALESVKGDAVIDGELVALDKNGISHFQLLQNALRHEAKLLYCAFDLMFLNGEDLRDLTLLERKKRLNDILPRHKLIAFSRHRKTSGTKFFDEAERKGLEGIMAKRAESTYRSGSRTDDWLKIKTKASGGRHRGIHGSATDTPVFRSAHPRGTREERLAVHRPRWNGLQPRDAERAARQAHQAESFEVTLRCEDEG
jgi:bifunctional non-homologous end joining protein LigD